MKAKDVCQVRLGAFDCRIVSDGAVAIETAGAYATPDGKGGTTQIVLPEKMLPLGMNQLYVDTGAHRVLIDTGVGDGMQDNAPNAGLLLTHLRRAQINPSMIDLVLLTHAHPDHCFGLTSKSGEAVFPNARLGLHRIEYDTWFHPDRSTHRNILSAFTVETQRQLRPYADRMVFIEEGTDIVPGLTALLTPGHSMGHCIFILASGEDRLVHIGDLAHHVHYETANPDWRLVYDADPELAAVSRRTVFGMLADRNWPVLATHFPYPGLGKLVRNSEAFAWHAASSEA